VLYFEPNRARAAFDAFVETWGAKYDKAVECLIKDRDALLAFYDFPAEHWRHLRTTNVIESSFATVRHRTVRSKGCLSNKTALAMIFKLAEAAERSWRRLNGHNLSRDDLVASHGADYGMPNLLSSPPGGGVHGSPCPLLICTKAGPSRRVTMIDFGTAKILSHRRNIQRCVTLLATELTELERQYLHKRIAEERAELERLQGTQRDLAGAVMAAEFPRETRTPSPTENLC
jgi:Transposase, Mutator family